MTTFLIQKEYWENNDFVLVKTSRFWIKEVVIWWLFDDNLRARGQEPEKKRTTNSGPWTPWKTFKIRAVIIMIFSMYKFWFSFIISILMSSIIIDLFWIINNFLIQCFECAQYLFAPSLMAFQNTDYGRPVRKSPSLHGWKSTPTPKFLGSGEAYFVCHIGPNFHISLIHAFIGCP